MTPKKWALYARVSTDQQSTGLEAQVRALKEYCHNNGITNFELFLDENQSGAKKSRPALDRMMTAARTGEINAVLVFAFSRFARSTTHLLTALNEFKKYDVQFMSLTEKIDTNSPMGMAMYTILGALSQMEREIIAQRVRAGLANARAKGKRLGRVKTRPSETIRKLRAAGFSYRKISEVCGCSHGSISAELREWEKEKREQASKEVSEMLDKKSSSTGGVGKPLISSTKNVGSRYW